MEAQTERCTDAASSSVSSVSTHTSTLKAQNLKLSRWTRMYGRWSWESERPRPASCAFEALLRNQHSVHGLYLLQSTTLLYIASLYRRNLPGLAKVLILRYTDVPITKTCAFGVDLLRTIYLAMPTSMTRMHEAAVFEDVRVYQRQGTKVALLNITGDGAVRPPWKPTIPICFIQGT